MEFDWDIFEKNNEETKNKTRQFEGYFSKRGYETTTTDDRAKGVMIREVNGRKVNINIYFYPERRFPKSSTTETDEVVPALMMYASGPGMRSLGIENLQLKTIRYPKEEDIDKLEEYLECLFIMLK